MSKSSFILTAPRYDPPLPDETLAECFIERLKKRHSNEPVNIDAVSKEIQTVGKLLEDTAKAIKFFQSLGLQKGDVVSIISENVIYYNVPLLAAWCLGVTVNLLNPDYTIGELRHTLPHIKPKVVLCGTNVSETVRELKKEFEFLENIIIFGTHSAESFENSLNSISVDKKFIEPMKFDVSQTGCLILLSSGTTGLPKGVLLTHKNLRYMLECIDKPECCDLTSKDTLLMVLPLFHIFGILIYLTTMMVPAKTIMLSKFKPGLFLSAIQEYKVNKLYLVPPLVLFLAKHPLVDNYDLSSVEDILHGGAALGTEAPREIIKRFGKMSFRHVYGSTEVTGACTFSVNNLNKGDTVGKLVKETQAKVSDLKTGEALGPMERGELCFKGPTIMAGYVNIENNNSIIDEDGFYHTGDIGYYDEDGFIFVVDRLKELIKYKGFQVAPVELENLLRTHHAVKDCGVIGKPDERAGELPLAFVVRQPGIDVTEQELVDYVSERISTNKRLYGGVRFIEEIPHSSSGKILRKRLQALLENSP